MQEHREWQRDLTTKLQLKNAAVAALPAGRLRDAAMVPDLTPFPLNRQMWASSPPAEEPDEEAAAAAKQQAVKTRKIGTKRR
jgi:hypothetical protein